MQNFSYTYNDICHSLVEVGLDKGDIAYFSTSLGMIGQCNEAKDNLSLNQLFFSAIKSVIGNEGTILVPTYSYTFGNSNKDRPLIFDPITSPSKVGPFSNFFLQQPNVIRSLDPMMSICGIGPYAIKLLKHIPPTSFGEDCVYSRLLKAESAKCVIIGIGPNWIPFLHHADWLAKVPFRYDKIFYGGIKHLGKTTYQNWHFTVRAPFKESRADGHSIGKLAVNQGLWKSSTLGRAKIYCGTYNKLFDFTINKLKKNIWATATGPRRKIFSFPITNKAMTEYPWSKDGFSSFLSEPRDVMSDNIFNILTSIKLNFPFVLENFNTGDNLYDWVVPEKMGPKEAMPYPSKMHIGHWRLKGKIDKSLILCLYLDSQRDKHLYGLKIGVEVINKLISHYNSPNLSIRIAFLSGGVGFGGLLTKLNTKKIIGAIHLFGNPTSSQHTRKSSRSSLSLKLAQFLKANKQAGVVLKDTIWPEMIGNNPVAIKKISEIPFDNSCVTVEPTDPGDKGLTNNQLKTFTEWFFKLIVQLDKSF